MRKTISRDYSIRLPAVDKEERARQTVANESPDARGGSRFWTRWIKGGSRSAGRSPQADPLAEDELDIYGALRLFPTLLESSSLPDGVIELVIDDFEGPTRQLFDIHDGLITPVDPGTAVPWASISGSPTAWAIALGPQCDVAELALTGDQHLAQRVLAALPHRA
jgi:hypothetical protein